jgi:hypothetical protein
MDEVYMKRDFEIGSNQVSAASSCMYSLGSEPLRARDGRPAGDRIWTA